MREVTVSICCITYNQGAYIKKAIEGFLSQETDFFYEILIHDDASSDGTVEIIKEYQKKYPDKILAILESENQMSKGIDVEYQVMASARGEYIALNEGDDYWCDKKKLQKQVDFLRKHKNCSLVTSAAFVIGKGEKVIGEVCPSFRSRYFSSQCIIQNGGGFFATNTMMFPKKYLRRFPVFYQESPVSDYPLTVLLSLWGKVYFMKDKMSVYRKEVEGSWSETVRKEKEKSQQFSIKYKKMLEKLDGYTGFCYHEAFAVEKQRNQYLNQIVQEDVINENERIKLMRKSYKKLYRKRKFCNKVRDFMCIYLPKLKKKIVRLRNHLLEKEKWGQIL